ncbi:MAG: DNA/RNA non-specific endonuclease [Bacteroidales bacterium]|nr:DNA/RNA non-specific endonuclease [Bacteroidales bacterium]
MTLKLRNSLLLVSIITVLAGCNGNISDPDYPDAALTLAGSRLNSDIRNLASALDAVFNQKDSVLRIDDFKEDGTKVGVSVVLGKAGTFDFWDDYGLEGYTVPATGIAVGDYASLSWTVRGEITSVCPPDCPQFDYWGGKWSVCNAEDQAWRQLGAPKKGSSRALVKIVSNDGVHLTLSVGTEASTGGQVVVLPFFKDSTDPGEDPGPGDDPAPGPGDDPDPQPQPSGAQPGWYELPQMDIKQSGNYLISESDPTLYYAWHMCAGGETDCNGNTARNFTACFSSEYHCPVWVAAPLHSMYKDKGRHDSYKPDPNMPKDIQWSSTGNASGLNKGHMLGSSDRNKTTLTNNQVFYYSNIAPQLNYDSNTGKGFNCGNGGWNILETWVDGQACSDTLYAVIGCYFKPYGDVYHNNTMVNPELLSGWGRTDVSNPTMFYYILLRTKAGNSGKALKNCTKDELKCVVLARAHTRALHGQAVSPLEMMSVSDLEKITGFTYFANVPQAPKDSFSASDWGL